MTTPIDRLASRVYDLEKRIAAVSTQPQLAYSSIEGGNINEYGVDGTIYSRTGEQHDGTHGSFVLNGPNPPTPTVPILAPVLNGIRARWDGLFEGDALVPMDWARIEVHASTTPDFTPDTADTLLDTIESPRGGEKVLALVPGVYYIAFVGRALSGKASPGSAQATASPIDLGDLLPPGGHIFYGATEPVGASEGDLWYADTGGGQFVPRRYTAGVWVDLPSAEADAALAAALAAQLTADSKNVIYRQIAAPTGGTYVTGDIWIDSDDGNRIYRWSGSAWTSAQFGGGAIATAGIADSHIQTLSAGKITAGTVSASLVLAGQIMTAAAGARTQMDSAGLKLFDSAGVQTIAIDPTGIGPKVDIQNPTTHSRLLSHVLGNYTAIEFRPPDLSGVADWNYGVALSEILDSDQPSLLLKSPYKPGGAGAYINLVGTGKTMTERYMRLDADTFYMTGALQVGSAADVSLLAGNAPPVRVGDLAASHLRIDGNEIVSMASDTLPGVMSLQASGASTRTTQAGHVNLGDLVICWSQKKATGYAPAASATMGQLSGASGAFNTGIRFAAAAVEVTTRDSTGWQDIRAAAFNVVSARAAKEGFRKPAWSAIQVLRDAPPELWERQGDELARTHFGPMADDLPAEILRTSPETDGSGDTLLVDLGSLVGLAIEAIRELDEEMDEYRVDGHTPLPSRKK